MGNKKYSVLAVLKVLEEHSDEEHSLYIKEIQGYVEEEYGIDVSAKTIRSDIRSLIDYGFDIRFIGSFKRVVTHSDGTVLDSDINTGCYLVGPLSDTDIEILFGALTNERFLSDNRYKELGDRLEGLSSTCGFKINKTAMLRGRRDIPYTDILYENLHTIKEAIARRKVLFFNYLPMIGNPPSYSRKDDRYISPYKIFVEDGVYYLVGAEQTDYYYRSELVFLRIERMRNVEIDCKKKYSILDIISPQMITDDYDKGRFRLCPGKNTRITFKYTTEIFFETADYFGRRNMGFTDMDYYGTEITAEVSVPEEAMIRFALMYAPEVEIIKPKALRAKVKKILSEAMKMHE